MAPRLGVDQDAGCVIPWHEAVVDEEMRAARHRQAILMRGAAKIERARKAAQRRQHAGLALR